MEKDEKDEKPKVNMDQFNLNPLPSPVYPPGTTFIMPVGMDYPPLEED
jgi:hypothetical protein